ncbi:MAG: 4-hydroxybenzoate octaprenyltransferase [Deltaproteobacteria bacterium]|nr:4-hydroxybenzoate octaprenyltransferase [Deltaproteobacteria bacterium]
MNAAALTQDKLAAISDLIRLPKQYGTLLVLWPTLWSLFIAADGRPSLELIVIFTLGAFIMRSAGCVVNDMADRGFDGRVKRTMSRPLASGRLSVKEALIVFAGLISLAFVLVLFLNLLTILLSFVAVGLAVLYPFVKRYSHWPQAVLGMAFGWGAIMAWTAVNGSLHIAAVLIFIANIAWSMAYDTIYALMDIDDDRRIGVKSLALFFGSGVHTALRVLYASSCALLALAGLAVDLGLVFYVGVLVAFVLFQIIVSRVRSGALSAMNGFLSNAVVGGWILVAVIIDLNL